MQGHKELLAWQKAMDLVVAVYDLTKTFPKAEVDGLASQMQRSAVSVPSNIAEGHALKQTQAYARPLTIANGSLAELETQLDIAKQPGYPRKETKQITDPIGEIGRMLFGLRRSLKSRPSAPES